MTQFKKSNEIAKHIYRVINEKSKEEVKILDVSKITTIADIFIITTASNTRAVSGLAQEIEDELTKLGYEPIGKEGHNSARWILLDYNGVITHIFHKEEAEFYNLDKLWNDGTEIDLDTK